MIKHAESSNGILKKERKERKTVIFNEKPNIREINIPSTADLIRSNTTLDTLRERAEEFNAPSNGGNLLDGSMGNFGIVNRRGSTFGGRRGSFVPGPGAMASRKDSVGGPGGRGSVDRGARRQSVSKNNTTCRLKITDSVKARRGSMIDPRGLLNNMVDPLGDEDVRRHSKSILPFNKQIHEDLVNAPKRSIKKGNVCFLKNNLVQLPSIMGDLEDPAEYMNNPNSGFVIEEKEDDGFDSIRSSYGRQTTADKRKSFSMPGEKLGEFGNNGLGPPSHNGNVRKSIIGSNRFGEATGINESAFLRSHAPIPRPSVFLKRKDVQKDMDDNDLLYRRNTLINQKKERMIERFGPFKKIGKRRQSRFGMSSSNEDDTENGQNTLKEEKRSFKTLVQCIIQAKRWNVPLYYGATGSEQQTNQYNSPMDFDLVSFKSESYACCTPKTKYLMTLEPWERTDQHVDIIYRTVKRMKCFNKYSKAIKRELCRVVMLEQFGAGRIILQQGHFGVSMYFILSGCVSVQITTTDQRTGEKYTQIVSEIKAGSSFGELALVKDIRRTAAVVCKCDSEFLRLDKNDFDNVLRRSMEIEWNDRMNQLKMIPYFLDWPLTELKTINLGWVEIFLEKFFLEKIFFEKFPLPRPKYPLQNPTLQNQLPHRRQHQRRTPTRKRLLYHQRPHQYRPENHHLHHH